MASTSQMITLDTSQSQQVDDHQGQRAVLADPGVRVLLADAHPLLRMGVAAAIDSQLDMRVVAEAENGRDAVGLYSRHRPDVAILDVRLPVMDGIDATREIRSAWPRARILILSDATGESHVRRALKAGASGYLPKNIAPAMLIETLRRVQLGQQAIPSDLALALATRLAERELSQRELEVLKRVALGNPNKRIATELDVTVDTIKAHMKSVLSKLGASDRTHAVTLALRRGLINLFD